MRWTLMGLLLMWVVVVSPRVGVGLSGSAIDRDGLSEERAIIVTTDKHYVDGIASEYDWLNVHYPEWKVLGQSLIGSDGRYYDIVKIGNNNGEKKEIYFDITAPRQEALDQIKPLWDEYKKKRSVADGAVKSEK